MKKWLIIASILVLCFIGFVGGAYIKALQPKKEAGYEAFEKAKKEGGLETMEEFYLYNGQDSYSVIIGKGDNGTKKIVWLPEDEKKEIVVENYKDGKSKKEILSIVNEKLNPQKIISVKLGMEKNVPLWEVTYLDESERFNYDYYDFKTGEWLKYYRSI
ncbi:cell wall elongation regulator TseB-like domain-containing protein [Peribacillus butanolivorans]|uniref:cell wall elongation regulator TseB-like domain-containing protein n=1 Tax=Peribacillus butanolivorans TaxID=421767 RepID=UPI00366A8927